MHLFSSLLLLCTLIDNMAVASITPLKDRIFVSRKSKITPLLMLSSGRPSQYKNYEEDNMDRAYKSVIEETMSIHRATEKYGILKSTLYDRVSGKVLLGSKSGSQRYLDSTEELELVNFPDHCASFGHSKSKAEVIQSVRHH